MRIGIVSPARNPGWEVQELLRAVRAQGHEALLIQPQNMVYTLPRDERARLTLDGQAFQVPDQLIVRSTKDVEGPVALLVRLCVHLGGASLDPIDRFSTGGNSKLLTTLSRWQAGYGSTSYIAFSKRTAEQLLLGLPGGAYPLVVKPISGRHGDGVVKLDTTNAVRQWLGQQPQDQDKATPYLFQHCEDFSHEYRVLMVNDHILAIVEKDKGPRPFNRENEARGTRFLPVVLSTQAHNDIAAAIAATCDPAGLLGVDVGWARDNQIHIIEENRAPEWENFQQALRQQQPTYDVADAIITSMQGNAYVAPQPAPAVPRPAEVRWQGPEEVAPAPTLNDLAHEVADLKAMITNLLERIG